MIDKTDIGIWHQLKQQDSNFNSVTDAMNVSGGCVVRTRTSKGSVAQTLLLNMRVVKVQEDKHIYYYKLEPGVIIP